MVLIRPEETDPPEAHHQDGAGMSNSLTYDPESLRVEDDSPSPVTSTSVHMIECLDKPEVVMLRLQGRSQQITPGMSLTDHQHQHQHHHQHHPGVYSDDADQEANGNPPMQQVIPRKPGQLDAGETALHVFAELTTSPPASQKVHKPVEAHGSVPFYQLFSFADSFDYFLMVVGTFGAIIHGAALPVFFLFFGKLLNGFGANSNNPHYAAHIVAKLDCNIKEGLLPRETMHPLMKCYAAKPQYALDFLYVGLVVWIASWAEVACWMQTGERQAARMRIEYLEAMLHQDIGFFDIDGRTTAIVSSLASDTLLVQDAISEKMGNFIHYMATFVAGFAVGFMSLWKLALVTLAVVPLIAIAGGFYAACLTEHTARTQQQYWEAGSIVEQAVAQVRTVYSFVGEARAVESYSKALQAALKLGYKGGLAKGLGMGTTYGVLFCCWALLLWYAGTLVRSGVTNGGKALSTIFAVIIGGIGLGQASPNLRAFAKGKVGAYKIMEMIKQKSIMQRGSDDTGKQLQNVQGQIEFRNVDFSYPSRPDVLVFRDFSLSIPPGKTVAIVGCSGSGKSTVVSLIERFYDPNSGEVLLDGHNVKSLELKWLRSQIGLVNQEPALFATSIKENILYGKDNGTNTDIEDACKAANAHAFIAQLPDRYDTQVGERGVQLSGGQKQRIAIARAVLKNPTILLLDEATSALDTASEQIVQEALDRVMVGRTTVVVAHRLSTVRNADFIAVVQNGVIVEMGTHEHLITRGQSGAYAALVRLQEMATSQDVDPCLNHESCRLSQLSVSKSGRALTREYSAVSNNPSEADSTRGLPVSDSKIRASSLWRLMKLNRPEWPYAVVGIAGSVVSGCMNPSFALVVSQTLKSYYNADHKKMEREISRYSLFFVGLGGLSIFGYFGQHFFFGIMGDNLVKRVREKMFAGILRNEVSWFDVNENNSGKVAARLSADASTVRAAIGDRISLLVQNFALLLATCAIAFIIQWRLAFVLLATFPILVGASFVEQMFLRGFSGDIAKAQARASMLAGEAVSNIRTVAAFNAEDKILRLFRHELEIPMEKSFWRGQVAGLGYGLSQLAMFGAYGLGLWYGSILVKNGVTEFGNVIKVFMVLIIAAFAVAETLALTPDIVRGGQALASVFEVLDRSTEIDSEDPEGEVVQSVKGDIELKKIMFAYPSRPEVIIFKDLTLKLRTGKSLALVGSSGSGKSSIIALIERFYDPILGRVFIDGRDIRKLNLKSLRRHIGLVQQEPALFATSIYENILYGRDGASEAEVVEASKLANADHFISALPEGYGTQVGDRGIQLSGGQKQRVAIARAVLKNPAILLLDEATSALDAESEQIVQDALDHLMQGRTTVMVAHRLSTIRNANSIAVIQDGAIVEEGSHHELMSRPGGAYCIVALIHSLQAEEKKLDPSVTCFNYLVHSQEIPYLFTSLDSASRADVPQEAVAEVIEVAKESSANNPGYSEEPDEATKSFFLQQTMYRIRDPKASLEFYSKVLGMTLIKRLDFPGPNFSLYFLGYENVADIPTVPAERVAFLFQRRATLELTHNWGTESDPNFRGYHSGNSQPRGYGHIGIVVDDVYKACQRFQRLGVQFVKKPDDGKMKGLAFIKDPDGYWIEIFDAPRMTDSINHLTT